MSTKASLLLFSIGLALGACNPGQSYSSLAVYEGGEAKFLKDSCAEAKGTNISRVSVINIGGRQLSIVQGNTCQAKKKSGFGLADKVEKPVYIHWGYAGNAEGDKLIHDGRKDIMPWATENFRVVDVSGMDIGKAQQKILADRKANPNSYGASSYVMVDIDAHGYVDENGVHRVVKGDVAPGSTTTSLTARPISSAHS